MPVDGIAGLLPPDGEDGLATAALIALSGGPLGLAVSGGGDSMAMLHLMARLTGGTGTTLRAVTVDHGLRPEAKAEARFVAEVCTGLGVAHDVLRWDHGDISGNLMQAAREARYRLLATWARKHGIARVALAHTADDQAETFLMGLARAAGLDGLSGMRPDFERDAVRFLRPFLHQSRAELRDWLQRQGLAWVDDPTNDDQRYLRTRARRALAALAPLGITVDRLGEVVEHLSTSRSALAAVVARVAAEEITETAGALSFERASFLAQGPEIGRLLLQAMLRWMASLPHAPRAAKLRTFQAAVAEGRDATLSGCRLRHRGGRVTLSREPRALGGPVRPGQLWDSRWRVEGLGQEVRALSADGLRQCPDWRASGLHRTVLEVTPGLWEGDRLIAAPCAGFGRASATCVPGFHAFLLSH